MRLNIYAQVLGSELLVGTIRTEPGYGESFEYAESWLEDSCAQPLSLSLPLKKGAFGAKQIRPYFEGLLPEGSVRDNIARMFRVSPNSYLRLLSEIGWECIGAVSVHGEEPRPDKSYKYMSEANMNRLSHVVAETGAWVNNPTRLSLAGAQPKSALYLSSNGEWYQPGGGAPSSHILKPAVASFKNLVLNEALCCRAAKLCNINTVEVSVLQTEVPMLCTKRYDRVTEANSESIDGLDSLYRLHQEDFSQALGIPSANKYETGESRYWIDVFNLLRSESTNALQDLQELWKRMSFDYLIGNCDSHLKNIALVRGVNWSELRLAPAYDLVCTHIYPNLSKKLAMGIGGIRDIDKVTPDCFMHQAETLGISQNWAMNTLADIAHMLSDALSTAANGLETLSLDGVDEIHSAIQASCQKRCELCM